MPVSKTEFKDFAENKPTTTEFKYRNRISRAYYAAYHSVKEYYLDDVKVDTNHSHSELIFSLKDSNQRSKRNIGYKLDSIKTRRTKADYKLESTIQLSDLETVLMELENLLDDLV